MTPEQEHQLDWNDRLQDWLDGDASGVASARDRAAAERHLGECAICQAQLEALETLDAKLTAALPQVALDSSFDARLFSQIGAIDESQRAAARQRIEQELQDNLRRLSRGWRRAVGFVIGGAIGSIALSFTLSAWLEETPIARTLIAQSAGEAGIVGANFAQTGLTAAVGAILGLIVARWLTSVAE